ncbi:MAG: glycine hydroxymethyltransferase, partial [Chlamydiia bacterium]|nr:glycine hydroxymethyltransferase [Chlamydiia bacterium]
MGNLENYLAKCPDGQRKLETIAYLATLDCLGKTCPQVARAIKSELKNQRNFLKMIASENYSSLPVQLAMGNLLTDKYAEGYVHHRFYAGCENVDTVEDLAIAEAKKLFGCDHAYVQPHSGIDANLVAFWSILIHTVQNPEIEALQKKSVFELSDDEYERIRQMMSKQVLLGMSLNSGGHLTHGFRHNVSSKMMRSFCYDVDPDTHLLDYSAIRNQAREIKPRILLAGYSAYPRLIDFAKMREIADEVGAVLMVDMAHFA